MPYTTLANSHWVSFHDPYQLPRPCPLTTQTTIAIYLNSYRTCLKNRMEFISCHIMPLISNSLGG